jgi:hypothetical protein
MTLDKHQIDGIGNLRVKILPALDFEQLLLNVGYSKIGTAPAQGNRIKAWWTHPTYRRLEVIYSPDTKIVITAYHTN